MISLMNNKASLEVLIKDKFLSSDNFNSLKIVSSIDLMIPYCILSINLKNNEMGDYMVTHEVITIKYKNQKHIFKYEFLIQSFDLNQIGPDNYTLVLNCLLNIPDYFQGLKQEFFENKSSKFVFGKIKGLEPDIQIKESDDTQTWLRYNTSEKEFIEYLYKHTYIKDDLVLGAITLDKKLRIRSVNDIMKDNISCGLSLDDVKNVAIDTFSFRTNYDVMSMKLSPTRKMQFFDVVDHKIKTKTLENISFMSKKNYNNLKEYRPYKILLE